MNRWILLALTAMAILAGSLTLSARAASQPHVAAGDAVAAGRYLVNYGACDQCHTPGYAQANGNIPEAKRLTGSSVGFQGPWGVSYPANLRLLMANITENTWLALVKNAGPGIHPPMPWVSLERLSEADQRAVYAYIRSLGPAGNEVPAFVPPGGKVNTPVILFEPIPASAAAQAATSAKGPR